MASMRFSPNCLGALLVLQMAGSAGAQVFDPGPSDPAIFDHVINVPPMGIPNDVGLGLPGETTQVNIGTGGQLFVRVIAEDGVEVNVDGGALQQGVDANAGSEVNLLTGVINGVFANPGSVVNVSGGVLHRGISNAITATGGQLNISGGSVGYFTAREGGEGNISGGLIDSFSAEDGGTINVLGGTIGSSSRASGGGVLNISGGSIKDNLKAFDGGTINISGGDIGIFFRAFSGSVVHITGGTFDEGFEALPGSDVTLTGGEFYLNGEPYIGPVISLSSGDVLTGTFADGSAFAFHNSATFPEADRLTDVKLNRVALPSLDVSPVIIDTEFPDRPSGLRSGQSLTLREGGALGVNFQVTHATLHVEDGRIGNGAEAVDSVVTISGGMIGDRFSAIAGSTINITGGTVGNSADVYAGSVMNVDGGSVGGSLDAFSGSEVNISAGSVGGSAKARDGSVINFRGGSLGYDFHAFAGSQVNLFGTEFFLDGVRLDALSLGEALSIPASFQTLTGTLSDGTAFNFVRGTPRDRTVTFDAGAVLTVTLVPEPQTMGLLALSGIVAIIGARCRRQDTAELA